MRKISSQLADCRSSSKNKYFFLTWIPLVLRDKQFLLLIGHSRGFECVIVRKDNVQKETTIQHELACTVQLSVPLCKQKLECIHATLLATMPLDNCIKYNIMVIRLGTRGYTIHFGKLYFMFNMETRFLCHYEKMGQVWSVR